MMLSFWLVNPVHPHSFTVLHYHIPKSTCSLSAKRWHVRFRSNRDDGQWRQPFVDKISVTDLAVGQGDITQQAHVSTNKFTVNICWESRQEQSSSPRGICKTWYNLASRASVQLFTVLTVCNVPRAGLRYIVQIEPKTQETVRPLMLLLFFSQKFSKHVITGRALSSPVVLNNCDLQK